MPRGGRRIGSGRKSGGATKKTREIADTAAVRGVKLPLEYMLAVLADETASQARRDTMALGAAPYMHPRLSAVGLSSHVGGGGGGGSNVSMDVQIYAVPRGARLDKSGVVTIEGEATELKPVAPFEGTPPLGLADQSEMSAPVEPPLPVHEIDTSNVTILRRRSDEDEGPAGAA